MSVRSRFVTQVLEEEGALMTRYQETAIRARTKSYSGDLLRRRMITVTGGTDASGTLRLRHMDYERFLDMKRLRRGSKAIRPNRKIHNRFVFGTYGHVASRLLTGFTEEFAEALRK